MYAKTLPILASNRVMLPKSHRNGVRSTRPACRGRAALGLTTQKDRARGGLNRPRRLARHHGFRPRTARNGGWREDGQIGLAAFEPTEADLAYPNGCSSHCRTLGGVPCSDVGANASTIPTRVCTRDAPGSAMKSWVELAPDIANAGAKTTASALHCRIIVHCPRPLAANVPICTPIVH